MRRSRLVATHASPAVDPRGGKLAARRRTQVVDPAAHRAADLPVERDAAGRGSAGPAHRRAVRADFRGELRRSPSAEKALRLAPMERYPKVRAARAAGKARIGHAGTTLRKAISGARILRLPRRLGNTPLAPKRAPARTPARGLGFSSKVAGLRHEGALPRRRAARPREASRARASARGRARVTVVPWAQSAGPWARSSRITAAVSSRRTPSRPVKPNPPASPSAVSSGV